MELEIDLSKYKDKIPEIYYPLVEFYVPIIANKSFEELTNFLEGIIGNNFNDIIYANMTKEEFLKAGDLLTQAWKIANEKQIEEVLFYKNLCTSILAVLLNSAFDGAVIIKGA